MGAAAAGTDRSVAPAPEPKTVQQGPEAIRRQRFCEQVLKLKLPELKTQSQGWKWVSETYAPRLQAHFKHMEKMLEKVLGDTSKIQEFAKIAKQFEILDKYNCKLKRFLDVYQKENWIFNFVESSNYSAAKLEFKPIDVSPYIQEMLFRNGEHVIMMSATILDKSGFCQLLGLKEHDVAFLSLPSPFPRSDMSNATPLAQSPPSQSQMAN